MASEDFGAVVARLLAGCGLQDDGAVAACVAASRNPTAALFAIPTSSLSKVMRNLKGKAVSDQSRADIEECFMKLVTKVRAPRKRTASWVEHCEPKLHETTSETISIMVACVHMQDNGCLPQVISVLAHSLGDNDLLSAVGGLHSSERATPSSRPVLSHPLPNQASHGANITSGATPASSYGSNASYVQPSLASATYLNNAIGNGISSNRGGAPQSNTGPIRATQPTSGNAVGQQLYAAAPAPAHPAASAAPTAFMATSGPIRATAAGMGSMPAVPPVAPSAVPAYATSAGLGAGPVPQLSSAVALASTGYNSRRSSVGTSAANASAPVGSGDGGAYMSSTPTSQAQAQYRSSAASGGQGSYQADYPQQQPALSALSSPPKAFEPLGQAASVAFVGAGGSRRPSVQQVQQEQQQMYRQQHSMFASDSLSEQHIDNHFSDNGSIGSPGSAIVATEQPVALNSRSQQQQQSAPPSSSVSSPAAALGSASTSSVPRAAPSSAASNRSDRAFTDANVSIPGEYGVRIPQQQQPQPQYQRQSYQQQYLQPSASPVHATEAAPSTPSSSSPSVRQVDYGLSTHEQQQQQASMYDVLLAYADQSSDGPAPAPTAATGAAATAVAGGGDRQHGATIDSSVLRYGSTVMVRMAASSRSSAQHAAPHDGGGIDGPFLRVTSSTVAEGSSRASHVGVGGGGRGQADECFIILHAATATAAAGTESGAAMGHPVRTGDPIVLRSTATGRFLSLDAAQSTSSSSTASVAFPYSASADARSLTLSSASSAPSSIAPPPPAARFTILSPDSIISSLAVVNGGWVDSLPRPYITAGQSILLLSHAAGSGSQQQQSIDRDNASVKTSARAAVSRLPVLLTGSAVADGLQHPSAPRRPQQHFPSAASPVVYIDTACTLIVPTADSLSGGHGVGAGGPLSAAGLARSLVSSPPAGSLWSLHPVHTSHGAATGNMGNLSSPAAAVIPQPAACPSDDVTCAPYITGTHVLPRELLPHSHAVGMPASTAASMTPSSPPSEGDVIMCLLDALQGQPSAWIHPTLDLPGRPSSSSSSGGVDWDAACCGPLTGTLLEHVRFQISGGASGRGGARMDPAHAALVEKVLPLARHVVRCKWYIERRSRHGAGLTAQALASAATALLHEFIKLLVQFEALLLRPKPDMPPLSLQQLWYYLQPSLRTITSLDTILYSQPFGNGGALLNSVSSFVTSSGDESVRTLATFLLERAAQPMLRWLEQWLFHGILEDPFREFFINENATSPSCNPESLSSDYYCRYWQDRYAMVQEQVPVFLQPHAHSILMAGKYLATLRMCHRAAGPLHLRGTFAPLAIGAGTGVHSAISQSALNRIGGMMSGSASGAANVNSIASPHHRQRSASASGTAGAASSRGAGNSSSNAASGTARSFGRSGSLVASGAGGASTGGSATSPTKTSTAIGADVNLQRELGAAESVSVLDSVFNARRVSVAASLASGTTSHAVAAAAAVPAAGLPSVSVAAPPSSRFNATAETLLQQAASTGGDGAVGSARGAPSPRVGSPAKPAPSGTRGANAGADVAAAGSGAPPAQPSGADLDTWIRSAKAGASAAENQMVMASASLQRRGAAGTLSSPSSTSVSLPFSLDPQTYTPAVSMAYSTAARQLLEYFYALPVAPPAPPSSLQVTSGRLLGCDLLGQLSSLKTFFLMARGDWMTHFLDAAESELAKEVPVVLTANQLQQQQQGNQGPVLSLQRLRALHEQSLRSSSSNVAEDPYHDRITPILAPSSLLAQLDHIQSGGAKPLPTAVAGLRGYNVFCLDFSVPWPASLVLSKHAITKYQLLFRHLFFVRHVERSVTTSWSSHQSCKELGIAVRSLLSLSFGLRQRMLHFLHNISYFITVEVIEPRWHEMAMSLREAATIDDVITSHNGFLDTCLSECLLTSHDLLKLLTKLVTLCLLFSDQMSRAIEEHRLSDEELDRRAGLNRAGLRHKDQMERGEYYSDSQALDTDAASAARRPQSQKARRASGASSIAGGASLTSRSQRDKTGTDGTSSAPLTAAQERVRRKARLEVQGDAMAHHMAQDGWQTMIEKSSRIFDTLLRDFISALVVRGRGDRGGHISHLLARLDYNGFYSNHLGLPTEV